MVVVVLVDVVVEVLVVEVLVDVDVVEVDVVDVVGGTDVVGGRVDVTTIVVECAWVVSRPSD